MWSWSVEGGMTEAGRTRTGTRSPGRSEGVVVMNHQAVLAAATVDIDGYDAETVAGGVVHFIQTLPLAGMASG